MKSRQVFLKYRQKVDTILRKIQMKSRLLGTKYRLFIYKSVHKGWVLVTISLNQTFLNIIVFPSHMFVLRFCACRINYKLMSLGYQKLPVIPSTLEYLE